MFSFTRPLFLFLDRDGVINVEKQEAYINHWDEFIFYENAEAAIGLLSPLVDKVFLVTNQKGVGRGITPIDELHRIHHNMVTAVEKSGGRFDKIYFAPDLENDSPNRKPNPGMALQARADFPEVVLENSIMIGNNGSDMQFGRNAGIGCNILLTTTKPLSAVDASLYDYHFDSLHAAAVWITSKLGTNPKI